MGSSHTVDKPPSLIILITRNQSLHLVNLESDELHRHLAGSPTNSLRPQDSNFSKNSLTHPSLTSSTVKGRFGLWFKSEWYRLSHRLAAVRYILSIMKLPETSQINRLASQSTKGKGVSPKVEVKSTLVIVRPYPQVGFNNRYHSRRTYSLICLNDISTYQHHGIYTSH